MRLICSNCDAQYEVPDDAIPPGGRDVQCSNCGLTWFQEHPGRPDEKVAGPTSSIPPETKDNPEPDISEAPTSKEPKNAQPPKPARRRDLDPAVAEVLRAEAELEAKARRKGPEVVESQPDLGLPDVSNAKGVGNVLPKHRAKAVKIDTEEEFYPSVPGDAGSRRDLLPDIEEINSTLRSNSDRSPNTDPGQTAQMEQQEKRSSRKGFFLSLALIAVLALTYVYSADLIEAIPETEPALTSYTQTIDSWRAWLDTQLSAALSWLDEVAAPPAE